MIWIDWLYDAECWRLVCTLSWHEVNNLQSCFCTLLALHNSSTTICCLHLHTKPMLTLNATNSSTIWVLGWNWESWPPLHCLKHFAHVVPALCNSCTSMELEQWQQSLLKHCVENLHQLLFGSKLTLAKNEVHSWSALGHSPVSRTQLTQIPTKDKH